MNIARTLNGDGASLVETEPRRRVQPRYREFFAYVLDDQLDRHAGPGMTLDHAIAQEARNYTEGRDEEIGRGVSTPAEYAATFEDVVIWEGIRVVAVLRVMPDGNLKVERFDR